MPTSANVYHWASVTAGPKYGRVCSWFAGWWNCIAWIFGCAAPSLFAANAVLAMYNLYHPDYVLERWHVFIAYLVIIWIDNGIIMFGQKYLARFATLSGTICIIFYFVSLLIVAIMPSKTGAGYASDSFVWADFQNLTGWSSNGLVFLMGMLNGAFTIGTPDGVCHLCEECPNPKVNVPKGVFIQLISGFLTSFTFYIALVSHNYYFLALTGSDSIGRLALRNHLPRRSVRLYNRLSATRCDLSPSHPLQIRHNGTPHALLS